MSLEEVGEEGVGNAVGKERERGLGEWKTIKDLACEVGGCVRL